jgi:hypothetical protein
MEFIFGLVVTENHLNTHTHTHKHIHIYISTLNHRFFSSHHYTSHLTHSDNFLFIRGIWRYWTAGCLITECWAVRYQVWHPWLVLKTSPVHIYHWMALLFRSSFPNHFRYPDWGQEPGTLTQTNRRLLTDERLLSTAYYTGQQHLNFLLAHERKYLF